MTSSERFPVWIYSVLVVAALTGVSFSQDSTISGKIPVPNGFARNTFPSGSFSNFVQSLPVKKNNQILLFNSKKLGQTPETLFTGYKIYAVVNVPLLFTTDIEQCADFCMRFWAEFYKANNNLGNLYLFDYNGNKKMYSSSGKSYTGFLKWAFSYSNSFSIKKGCMVIADSAVVPGDMVVQNETGGIGHVSMIVDRCEDSSGKRLYLIGYSFMPAQEFHIEKASDEYGKGGWFSLPGYYQYLEENLDLGKPVLRRFRFS